MQLSSFARCALFLCLAGVSASCLEQFDPTRYKAKEEEERIAAAKPVLKLTETGDLPATGPVVVSADERFASFCAGCHGPQGGGDGPAGASLNPHPRNLTDAAWQASVSDQHIYDTIKNGGASVGLSAMMAPWGSVLTDDEIKAIVVKVRSFKKG